jgi:hypothetical protein
MATISSLISELRTDIADDNSTRWTDAQLLKFFQKSIRRCNRIAQRNNLWFARKKATLTTTGLDYVTLSSTISDFDVLIRMYKTDTQNDVIVCEDYDWETLVAPAPGYYAYFDFQNDKILFKGTPGNGTTYSVYYMPLVDPSSYTVASSTPWNGRLDDIIMEYVTSRALNVDEMDITVDMKLLTDMENQILSAYSNNTPSMVDATGWL